jgi:hypothetical protein
MIGTLLEDIKSGMDIASVKKRFATKMNPTQYMRPQAPASAGNIAAAEKLVEQLGIAPALERRFARLDEVKTIWKPTPIKEEEAGGVFGHLKPKATKAAPVVAPVQDITWSKFARTVLPKALEILVHLRDQSYPLVGCLTAVHFDAPPILQWDSEENRNPFSWYLYTGGSRPRDWNLAANTWTKVNAVMLKPSMWAGEDKFTHQGTGAVFILDGAKDSRTAGACLFPEILKSELHAIRSTIESFSHRAKLEGREEGDANGILIGQKNDGATIRVTTELGVADYRIDRWD